MLNAIVIGDIIIELLSKEEQLKALLSDGRLSSQQGFSSTKHLPFKDFCLMSTKTLYRFCFLGEGGGWGGGVLHGLFTVMNVIYM